MSVVDITEQLASKKRVDEYLIRHYDYCRQYRDMVLEHRLAVAEQVKAKLEELNELLRWVRVKVTYMDDECDYCYDACFSVEPFSLYEDGELHLCLWEETGQAG